MFECACGGMSKCVSWLKLWILREVTNAGSACEGNAAEVNLPKTGNQFHERALAAAVTADESNLLSGLNRHSGAVEHDVGAETVTNVGERGNRHRGIKQGTRSN